MPNIVVTGARVHNLRSIDVVLPRNALVVITGPSGSGKSSLALDTIYAEGQRRYVESLSAHARQYLQQMTRPDVDTIEGLSPAIAIEQRAPTRSPRSTVGTITEIYDHLRVLFARTGQVHCWRCDAAIEAHTVQQIVDRGLALPEGARFIVVAPVVRCERGDQLQLLSRLRADGYTRVAVDGERVDLAAAVPALDDGAPHTVDVYVDRLVAKSGMRQRLADSVELALKLAGGMVRLEVSGGESQVFSERFACSACGIAYPELEPRMFSFNSPHGACAQCDGLGTRMEFDPDRIIADPRRSLRDGAIQPWQRLNSAFYRGVLESVAYAQDIDLDCPWSELPSAAQQLLLHGSGDRDIEMSYDKEGHQHRLRKPFEGVIPNLRRRLEPQRHDGRDAAYQELGQYLSQAPCSGCQGARLRVEARFVRLGGVTLPALCALPLARAREVLSELELSERDRAVGGQALRAVIDRLGFLLEVGLDYLTLSRPAVTLAGGEAQRIRLAAQLGASLTGVLYVLDEPSLGLHSRDIERLLGALRGLCDRGNSLLVVEHDEAIIRSADHLVDMGPGAGTQGGQVVAVGTPEQVSEVVGSITGAYLAGREQIPIPERRRPSGGPALEVCGAAHNNLRAVNARFPLGLLICVTGVSGSGKSSLVVDTLLPAVRLALGEAAGEVGAYDELRGVQAIEQVVAINQSPIGRSPRSNPATYTGLMSPLRELFAELPESKARGYKSGRYSFNVKGGRCEACQGDGTLRVEMHFLPDVYVQCELCRGRRYNRETLEVRYKGYSIADLLELSVQDASSVLGAIPRIRTRLDSLRDVGLGYLALGQSATTLSGGESQRLRLAKELARKTAGKALYVLDEPTSGLHFHDIRQLLEVLDLLVRAGNTVIVIEHNLDVIKCADYVIDLGPEGGSGGGEILLAGTPEQLAAAGPESHTARYLRGVLST